MDPLGHSRTPSDHREIRRDPGTRVARGPASTATSRPWWPRTPRPGVAMVVAVHSTVLGPALGGTRMAPYADAADPGAAAYADALRLSRAMTYKNSLAGLDHGGGKGVILGVPQDKDPRVLRAYGRLVASLDGRYVTAGDVGVTVADMDVIAETCPWTTGRSPERGGVGDSGILTALGVFRGPAGQRGSGVRHRRPVRPPRRRGRRRQGGRTAHRRTWSTRGLTWSPPTRHAGAVAAVLDQHPTGAVRRVARRPPRDGARDPVAQRHGRTGHPRPRPHCSPSD